MEAGTLIEWLVKPGDRVKRGDVVAIVDTQKGAIEVEIYQSGEIEQILVPLDTKVPVGTPLARLRGEGEAKPVTASPSMAPPPVPTTPAVAALEPSPVAPAAPPAVEVSGTGRVRASPAARTLAEARGIDLATVTGSGPAGAITYADVDRMAVKPAAPAEKKRAPSLDLNAMRSAIAAAMARSKREIPHYYLENQVDVSACERWLAEKNAALPPESRILMGALAIKAVALAARRFPAFNGFYSNNKFESSKAVHVGVAISIRGGGLTAPALHDADQLSIDDLMNRLRDLVQRTRAGRIRSSEMADPTITVSSLGERGVDALYGGDLSAASRHRWIRQSGASTLGRRWRDRPPSGRHHHTVGRSPGQRRSHRRTIPGRDRQGVAGAWKAMSDIDIRQIVQEELGNIAPEIDLTAVEPTADLREAVDIDSMDFLTFVTALHHRTGIDIPEVDYPKLVTLKGMFAYLDAKLKAAAK
jgi:pyruvate dehydrogenase E2 component (dihydrolipoamide acetyltransferase)